MSLASPVPVDFVRPVNGLGLRKLRCAQAWCGAERFSPQSGARGWCYLRGMADKHFFDELSERMSEALRDSPAQDVEKNLKAMLAAWFSRLDLVLREDFEVQKKLLERAQAKLAELEARLADLESRKQ